MAKGKLIGIRRVDNKVIQAAFAGQIYEFSDDQIIWEIFSKTIANDDLYLEMILANNDVQAIIGNGTQRQLILRGGEESIKKALKAIGYSLG